MVADGSEELAATPLHTRRRSNSMSNGQNDFKSKFEMRDEFDEIDEEAVVADGEESRVVPVASMTTSEASTATSST